MLIACRSVSLEFRNFTNATPITAANKRTAAITPITMPATSPELKPSSEI